jgi:hypothetical protein
VQLGLDEALEQDAALARGVVTRGGRILNPSLQAIYDSAEK